ncbi:hypothetical protein T12_682 [Trichinella patagoniensis]|uniref:Uncharacterized protein n=1 Tax=Trichinella patagoniensis TaxID=990121 RepID=A0A0V1AG40_9BILA|nr:hypothetical protein T12_682 [Trichinella patagoniensis]
MHIVYDFKAELAFHLSTRKIGQAHEARACSRESQQPTIVVQLRPHPIVSLLIISIILAFSSNYSPLCSLRCYSSSMS